MDAGVRATQDAKAEDWVRVSSMTAIGSANTNRPFYPAECRLAVVG